MNGFTIWGVEFSRHQEQLEGRARAHPTDQEFTLHKTYNVNTITNYAALKHLAPTGRDYYGANDNDFNRAA